MGERVGVFNPTDEAVEVENWSSGAGLVAAEQRANYSAELATAKHKEANSPESSVRAEHSTARAEHSTARLCYLEALIVASEGLEGGCDTYILEYISRYVSYFFALIILFSLILFGNWMYLVDLMSCPTFQKLQ